MSSLVAHHFRCPACDYDLYTAPQGGTCPECGTRIPKRKGLDKPKNPRRVNSQHRFRIRRARKSLYWTIPLTLIGALACFAAFWWSLAAGLKFLFCVFTFMSALPCLGALFDIRRAKELMVPEEAEAKIEATAESAFANEG